MAAWPYSTATWRRLRLAKLMDDPLCEFCRAAGRYEPAEAVDHDKPISSGGEPFPPLEGLTSLCHSCHNRKTGVEQDGRAGGRKTFKRVIRGYDPATGHPVGGWN